MDLGAGYHGYSSDVTRTIPSDGRFDEGPEREIYRCVLDAQKAAEKILKPGVTWKQLDEAARAVIVERKLTRWSYAHAEDDQVRHSLGHFVGLSVHDSGPYTRPLEAGMCITIEPGIYDKQQGIGVRIEDIYLVTPDGFERLSAAAPREIEEIEREMKKP
jgi:Xaa-Pro aminopeptidase